MSKRSENKAEGEFLELLTKFRGEYAAADYRKQRRCLAHIASGIEKVSIPEAKDFLRSLYKSLEKAAKPKNTDE